MSNEGLTERDYKILTAGFLPEEIGKIGKYDYIKRSAIHRRLRLVDRNWSNDVHTYVQVIGDTVTVWGSLTLKGVTRTNSVSKNLVAYASKENGGEHISESEYARELANTIKKATSALIFRCAEAFEIGLYMKEKRTPHTLESVLHEQQKPTPPIITLPPVTTPPPAPGTPTPAVQDNRSMLQGGSQFIGDPPPSGDTPPHWALNGLGEKIKARMNDLGLDWHADLKSQLEPGKTLTKLSDTSLSYDAVYTMLEKIKVQKLAEDLEKKRNAQSSSSKGDEPISVRGDKLLEGDLVHGLRGRLGRPSRLMHYLGDTDDGAFAEWIVWHETPLTTTNVDRLPFGKDLTFKVSRGRELVAPTDDVLEKVDYLKRTYADLGRGVSTH